MSWIVVTPSDAACASAARAFSIVSSSASGGTTRVTSAIALSLKTPVGSPLGSRTIVPPSGDAVSRVTPASFIASAFATPMCPSSRCTNTG